MHAQTRKAASHETGPNPNSERRLLEIAIDSRLVCRGGLPKLRFMRFVLLLLGTWLGGAGSVVQSSDVNQPNILLIISDDQAWGDYGFMGHAHLNTPRLDRLATESLTFHRGYTPVPLCRPALSSIITGLYPHQHGVTGNDPSLPDVGVNAMAQRTNPKYAKCYETIIRNFQQRPNLVRDLVARGYVALQTGKWWEANPVKTAGFTQAMTRGEGKGARHGDDGLSIGREGLEPIRQFIDGAQGKPWFVWYAPFLPHAPHTPPEQLFQRYQKVAPTEAVARYWGCVEWFDQTCGELLDMIDRRGIRENTIVIYTTDNGWIQDPKRANRFAPRSKRTAYEGGVRTPIMIRWPGRVAPRMDPEHLASNVDIWPTLGALLRVPVTEGLPGIDLTSTEAVASRKRIFGEQYAHDIADVAVPTRSLEHRWMIEGWWKLIVPTEGGAAELYDLKRDPAEKADLAGDNAERVEALRGRLDAWWKPAL